MFDLRAALLAEIPTLSINHVDTTVDYRSTELALSNANQCVFDAAAVLIGDWRSESIPWVYSYNQVRNEIELIVAVKSEAAKAAIDDIQRALRLGLERNNLDQPDHRWTRLKEVTETRKLEQTGIFYQIATFEVFAVEASAAYTTTPKPFNLPSITIDDPGTPVIDGATDLVFTGTYSQGDYSVSSVFVAAYRAVTGARAFFGEAVLVGGAWSVRWETPEKKDVANDAGTYGYWVNARVIDSAGFTDSETTAINITRS